MQLNCFELIRKFGYVWCHRWSLAVPFLFYAALFFLTWTVSLPLRSSFKHKEKINLHSDNTAQSKDINSNYGRKAIVGENNIGLRNEDPTELLRSIFVKADKDFNKLLSVDELAEWINTKIQEHISEALKENFGIFATIDQNPRNGMISWDEYHAYFLQQKGLSSDYKGMTRVDKESLMRERASWSEAARTDPDHLTLDEFLAFRHPESSHANLLTLVDDLLDKFDRDGDEILSEDEFSGLELVTQKKGEEDRRRIEFRNNVDTDNDGKADRRELLLYIDPKNPRKAREEAETLISLSDTNNDNNLSLLEILSKMGLFLGSKMVDTAGSFHDEF